MQTCARKQNQPQKPVSSNLARSHTAISRLNHRADLRLHLQRTIGNQAVQRMLQTHVEELNAGLTGTASPHFGHDFSRIPIHPPAAGAIQAKLAINKPGDEYEQEADRVAERVMWLPEPGLQRVCACGGDCPTCQTEQSGQEHEHVQTMRAGSSDLGQTSVPSIVHEALRSPGQSLDPTLRAFMESRFGRDFSGVRVHSDARAAESAQAVNASAYTVGQDIVFGAGQYRLGMVAGKRLLAHELTHVVQQTSPAVKVNAASASLEERTSRARRDSTGRDAAGLPPNAERQTATVSPAPTTLQRTVNKDFPEAPLKPTPEAPLTPTSKCPDGFTLKHRATWLRCDETSGTRRSGCAFCNNGEQESNCAEILKLLGNYRVIAPIEGRCGSKFQITTPQPGAPVIDVVKAEIPGGDTQLDINQGVITELGLDVKTGRYDVCLKGPTGHDDRLVISGGSACQKPKK